MSDEVFKKAMEDTIKASLPPLIEEKELNVEQALDLTIENNKSAWSRLKDKINGDYADRAALVIEALPDREFIKVYMKLLEYVNPKIVRKEIIGAEEEDNEIKILIVQNNNTEDEKTIDISHKTIEE